MPTYRITAPDGKTYRIDGPAGATQEQVRSAIIAQNPHLAERPDNARRGTGAISAETDAAAVSNSGGAMAALRGAGGAVRDMAAGAVRGAGSIGATLLAPIDIAADAMMPARRDGQSRNQARRSAMTQALGRLGADTDSFGFSAGKVGAEIAGTAGVGGAISNTGRAIPALARAAPRVLNTIESGGFALGAGPSRAGVVARLADAGTRALGGAISGGAAAGLVDPQNAATGALIGGALPGATQLAGAAGRAVGGVLRGPEQSAALRASVEGARQAGYVIPPTQARGSLGNRVAEGFAGKLTTAQNASARNQATTNRLAARALGLAEDTQITPDVLNQVRAAGGQQYERLAQEIGVLNLGTGYTRALDRIAAPFQRTAAALPDRAPSPVIDLVDGLRVPQIDGASAVEVVKQLRSQADDAFLAGNTDVGRAARAAATAIEDAMEQQLAQSAPQALQQFRAARTLIARAHTVGRALNPANGNIDARALGAQIRRNRPLTGELAQAGRFGLQFKTAAQPTEAMGSLPQMSPLDWAVAGISGGGAMMGGGIPAGVAMFARPGVRAGILSPVVQNRLVQPAATNIGQGVNELARGGRYLIPAIANDR